ncbi:MAG: hypothetical protein CMB43_02665 [Euryarchaeota archaeon]|nr:hypothetical protein [Euryarchaeota archaeon]
MNGRNRRRKDVPFNPFAQNAAAERNRRHAEKAKEKRRLEAQNQAASTISSSTSDNKSKTLEELRNQAREKLAVDATKTEAPVMEESKPILEIPPPEPKIESQPVIIETSAAEIIEPKTTREDRLAELKRKSQKSKDKAKATKNNTKLEVKPETEILDGDNHEGLESSVIEIDDVQDKSSNPGKNLNVFKTIQSVDRTSAGISKKKRKTRRIDKKGGGRQRLEKKLNRQKILEFKYVAREILAHPDIPEEHRSNVLGQMIAKGERISIDAAIEFIDQKQAEMILTSEISDKLKQEIKSISTRR